MGKILIVEDDSLIVKVYSTRLKADGHQVLTAFDGEIGLALAKKEKPEVILLDIMMPKVSGLEVLAELKKDSSTAKIPVILYSNLGREEEISKAKKLGAAVFLTKADYTPQQVVAKIESYLK
ncbi:response regulator [Candidatus Beckwithbacteria bacterium CG10_big_fil_rev_8_21_14_0_10_34_10]|uniref:Response regulator n=1 Tax=Candidatus Beckwithbacteria bacterium CG10_big_fil_rev_8_21_14_0_10_34_10 TaxID=1974495 RepID=A0A2H0WAS3_9BACT|nr:MAG: response regulator [Candidatus Beckwithbacteria bacterium CG10_big_fil_rev_8_21_14_0_10_34_10]